MNKNIIDNSLDGNSRLKRHLLSEVSSLFSKIEYIKWNVVSV